MKRFKLVQVVSDAYLLDSLVGCEYSHRDAQEIGWPPNDAEFAYELLDALEVGETIPDADSDVWERVA